MYVYLCIKIIAPHSPSMVASIVGTSVKARSRTRERNEEPLPKPPRRQIGRGRSDPTAEDEFMEADGGLNSPLQSAPPPPRTQASAPQSVTDAQPPATPQSQSLVVIQETHKVQEKPQYNYAKTPTTTIASKKESEAKPAHHQLTPTVRELTANSSPTATNGDSAFLMPPSKEEPTKWGLQLSTRSFPTYEDAVQGGHYQNDLPDVDTQNPVEAALAKFSLTTMKDRSVYFEDITSSRIVDLEHRINDALCECQSEVDTVKMKQNAQDTRLEALENAIK